MIHALRRKSGQTVYVISSHQIWLPGVYDSPRTARYAFRCPDAVLVRLARDVCAHGGVITWQMVYEALHPTDISRLPRGAGRRVRWKNAGAGGLYTDM